jgi:hypothetical protein
LGSLTDTLKLGYRRGIPPLLSTHFATPGWIKPTGEYVTAPTLVLLADMACATLVERVMAAIADMIYLQG